MADQAFRGFLGKCGEPFFAGDDQGSRLREGIDSASVEALAPDATLVAHELLAVAFLALPGPDEFVLKGGPRISQARWQRRADAGSEQEGEGHCDAKPSSKTERGVHTVSQADALSFPGPIRFRPAAFP